MERNWPPLRIRTLSVHEQKALICACWPGLDCRVTGGRLTCLGDIQPTPLSGSYRVGLEYQTNGNPRVWVQAPSLRRRSEDPDRPIPHTYGSTQSGQERPCLFVPGQNEWRSDMSLAVTVIPWFYEWLAHYEIWHVTGDWCGGGLDHGNGTKQ